MEIKNNLEKSQKELGKKIQISNKLIIKSIALAFERTNTAPFNIEGMVMDIISNFNGRATEEEIISAIKKGSLGYYGKTFKLSTQEVCIWIYKYLKDVDENKTKMVY